MAKSETTTHAGCAVSRTAHPAHEVTPGTGQFAAIDAETIRRTHDTVLWGQRYPSGEEGEHLTDLLRGHIQLLAPEVAGYALRMRGERRRTAEHVLARGRRLLLRGAVTPQEDVPPYVWDLATQCRALLVLYQSPGPLDEPAVGDDALEIRS